MNKHTFSRYTLEDCHTARGTVIVIDVLRAFSTAASAFAAGADQILLVSTAAEALELKQKHENSFTMGEVNGIPIPEFDYSNSPAQFLDLDLRGATLIQRTTAGTQGVVRSVNAGRIFAGSFNVAGATAAAVRRLSETVVSFVVTGRHSGEDGDEDCALADYLEELIRGNTPDASSFISRIRTANWGKRFGTPDHPYLSLQDLDLCCELDRHSFALPIDAENGRFRMIQGGNQ